MLAGELEKKREAIATVRADIGEVEVFALPKLIALTKVEAGIKSDSLAGAFVDEAASDAEVMNTITRVAIPIVLGIAALVSAGFGAPVLAGVLAGGSAGVGALGVAQDVASFNLRAALADTTFDKASAISDDDPSLFWLALDVVGVFADIGEAFSVFRKLRGPVQGVIASGEGATEDLKVLKAEGALGEKIAARAKLLSAEAGGAEVVLAGGTAERDALAAAGNLASTAGKVGVRVGDHQVWATGLGLMGCTFCQHILDKYSDVLRSEPVIAKQLARLDADARKLYREMSPGFKAKLEVIAAEAGSLMGTLDMARHKRGLTWAKDIKSMERMFADLRVRGVREGELPMVRDVLEGRRSAYSLNDTTRGIVESLWFGENVAAWEAGVDIVRTGKFGHLASVEQIKSIDLRKSSYLTSGAAYDRLTMEIDNLRTYTGRMTRSGPEWVEPGASRVLTVLLPEDVLLGAGKGGASEDMLEEIERARYYGFTRNPPVTLAIEYRRSS